MRAAAEPLSTVSKYMMRLTGALLLVTLALVLAPSQAGAQASHVVIRVTDGNDVLANALVTVRNARRQTVASGTTDGAGTVTLDVAPGRYRVEATADGHIATDNSSQDLEPIDGDVAMWLSLRRAVVLRGTPSQLIAPRAQRPPPRLQAVGSPVTLTLRDEAGRQPSAASVRFFSTPRAAGTLILEAGVGSSVEGDGTVRLGPILPGAVIVYARTVDTSPALVGSTRLETDGEPLDDVRIVLLPAARVEGRVVFEGRARPLHNQGGLRVVDSVDGMSFGVVSGSPRGAVAYDGTFAVDGLFDTACLTLWGVGDGWRLASIDALGENYLNRPIPLPPGQTVRDVVLRVVPDPTASDRGGRCPFPWDPQ